jgi:threonine aldolase
LIDLRSDTVTVPTAAMRRAMAEAEVGDDVYREDPTVNRLQDRAAEIFEKEAALFVPTGTMGNQIAIRLHTRPGQEVVVEEKAHIFNYEMAALAALSGCLARPVRGKRGILAWQDIEPALAPDIYYRARTGLIALENTHNMAGGTVMSVKQTGEVCRLAHERGLPVHLDGARVFNAGAALEVSVADLARNCDSLMFCLSKGLSAPAGSLLLGTRGFIEEAWRVRKLFGGGMRQVGILAAAALIALEEMPQRLPEDHRNARFLAERLCQSRAFRVDMEGVQTNIVVAELEWGDSSRFLTLLREQGVLAGATGPAQVRFVTHKDVSRRDIETAARRIEEVARLTEPR